MLSYNKGLKRLVLSSNLVDDDGMAAVRSLQATRPLYCRLLTPESPLPHLRLPPQLVRAQLADGIAANKSLETLVSAGCAPMHTRRCGDARVVGS
jgi:hypothetical protein